MSPELIFEKYNIPDKTKFYATTSHQFKRDLFEFFTDCQEKTFIEFGTSTGYSSVFVSEFFKHVHTINIKLTDQTKELLSKAKNVTPYIFDLYDFSAEEHMKKIGLGDVFFVDAVHTYKAVISDTYLAKRFASEDAYIIYDDYGLYPKIKLAVDELVNEKEIEIVKFIGNKEGWKYGSQTGTLQRTLKDYEGVICKIL